MKSAEGNSVRSFLTGGGIAFSAVRSLPRTGVYLLDGGRNPEETARKVAALNGVAWAEPSLPLLWHEAPPDAHFQVQWSLSNTADPLAEEELTFLNGGRSVTLSPGADVKALQAWTVTRGNPSVVAAVMDTGIGPYIHDLNANLWVNGGEIPDNGIDDDGNGYVDDVNGWNALDGNGNIFDQGEHGSHCSGIIAARQDEYGISGIAPEVSVMALVGFETAHVLANTEYLLAQRERGINVAAVNMSFGTGIPYSRAVEEALAKLEAAGVLVFAAAGNFSTDNDIAHFSYPASLPFGNIVSVGSTGPTDEQSFFSQWGSRTVDIHAPGEFILSTIPSKFVSNGYSERIDRTWNTWVTKSGTSMATPLTLGAAALIFSAHPEADWRGVKAQLLATADPLPSLSGKSRTGGRVNAGRAVTEPLRVRPALFEVSALFPSPGEELSLSGFNLDQGGPLSLVDRTGQRLPVNERGRTSGTASLTLPDRDFADARLVLEIETDRADTLTALPFLLTRPGKAEPAVNVQPREKDEEFRAWPSSGQTTVVNSSVYGTAAFEELDQYGNIVTVPLPAVFSLEDRTLRKAPLGTEGDIYSQTDLNFSSTSYCSSGTMVYLAGQSAEGWLYRYDTEKKELSRLVLLPGEIRQKSFSSPGLAVEGDFLYMAGGSAFSVEWEGGDRALASVYRLDLRSLEWEEWRTLSEGRFASAAAIIEGNFVVAGGLTYRQITAGDMTMTEKFPTTAVDIIPLDGGAPRRASLPFLSSCGAVARDEGDDGLLLFGGSVPYMMGLSMGTPLAARTSSDGEEQEWAVAPFRFPFVAAGGGWAFFAEGKARLLSRGWGEQYDRGLQLFSAPDPRPEPPSGGCSALSPGWPLLFALPLLLLRKK